MARQGQSFANYMSQGQQAQREAAHALKPKTGEEEKKDGEAGDDEGESSYYDEEEGESEEEESTTAPKTATASTAYQSHGKEATEAE